MTPTHCECGRALAWYTIDDWPGEGAEPADCDSWDCADCKCGRQYTALPDGTVDVQWLFPDERGEAA